MHIGFDVTNRESLTEPIMENPLVVFAAPDHPLVRLTEPACIDHLIEHGFVIRADGPGTCMAMGRFFYHHD